MNAPRQFRIWLALPLLAIGSHALSAADGAPALQGGNTPGMRGVVYGLFEDQTGGRIGRVQIDKVDVEYEHRGFLRVAWRPLVVLEGVTLDISAAAAWPGAGAKIIDALRVTGRTHAPVLRNVRVRLAGQSACEITAPKASLRADGGLELIGTRWLAGQAPGNAAGDFCFWLAGPLAGQLTALAPPGRAVAQTFSQDQSPAQSSP